MQNSTNWVTALKTKINRIYKRMYVKALITYVGKCRFCDESDISLLRFVQTGGRHPLNRTINRMATQNVGWKKLNQAIRISSVVCPTHELKIKGDPRYLDGLIDAEKQQDQKRADEKMILNRLKGEYSL